MNAMSLLRVGDRHPSEKVYRAEDAMSQAPAAVFNLGSNAPSAGDIVWAYPVTKLPDGTPLMICWFEQPHVCEPE